MKKAAKDRYRQASEHGVEQMAWDNLGHGWRIHCLCGWSSSPWERAGGAGDEFDDHLKEMK